MLIIVYFISQLDIINFKHFFIAAAFSSLLISVDVFYQYIFGFNIIGLESYIHHNTSFFGDELISGGFIQNFSFFSILFLVYVFRNNYYLRIISTTAAISILGLGIIISGNRMPFFLFLFGLLLVFFFSKQLRIILLISFLILCTNVGFLMSYDNKIKENYVSFFGNSKYIVIRSIERIKNDPSEIILMEEEEFKDPTERDAYGKLIFTAVEVWKLQKIFGNGIKSFRKDCVKFVHENERGTCSIHPHNYYLEILTDLGIIGFISAMAIALIFIVFLAKNYRILNGNKVQNLFLLAATISLFLGVFPIKSTGSIFTTNNATYIILVSAIVLCHKRLLEGKNFS